MYRCDVFINCHKENRIHGNLKDAIKMTVKILQKNNLGVNTQ